MDPRLKQLARAVLLMRQLQTEYFRTKDRGTLQDCKRQEKFVDDLVAEILSPPQPTLFDAPPAGIDTDAQEGE